ncbi:MAG: isoprenylcysteine carboxylmethyltransferase family protein, partial [Bacteroidota bacterium]
MVLLVSFHVLEWLVTAIMRPKELEFKSWLLNHSKEYTIAILVSTVEYWLEYFLIPASWNFKGQSYFVMMGFFGSLFALIIRCKAMFDCGSNFDHIPMMERKPDHELVTRGIYQYIRHPAYFGWFYWTLSSQLLLANPISFLGFSAASISFFRERIAVEEAFLFKFYGEKYEKYARSTFIGIPFVEGYMNSSKFREKD